MYALSIAFGEPNFYFTLFVLFLNCGFMFILIVHAIVCIQKMGGLLTLLTKEKDWSKERADGVVPRLMELRGEIVRAERDRRKGRARELRRQLEIEQAQALSADSRSGQSVRQ